MASIDEVGSSGLLLERDEALAELAQAVDQAVDGVGSIVLVSGEAGEGKTTLIRHFLDESDPAVSVIESQCDPLTTPSPLAPLTEVAHALDLGDLSGQATDRASLFASVLRALTDRAPAVWVIEDIHWADGSTLDLIRFLGRRCAQSPTVIAVTYRTEEVAADTPLREVLGELARSANCRRIELAPLSVEAVRVLAGSTVADRMHAVTGGNAFFVTEVLASDSTGVPASVRDAVLGRIASLADEERRVVELVSVAPRRLPYDAAPAVLGTGDEVIERTLASGVIVGRDDGMSFRHELARQAVEMSIAVPLRRQLHRELLAFSRAHDAPTAILAHHAVRSGDGASIVDFCPDAARRAIELGAMREAVQLLDATLLHRAELEPDALVEVMIQSVNAQTAVGAVSAAADLVDDMLRAARLSGNDCIVAKAWAAAARPHYDSGDRIAARAAANDAVAAAERCGDDETLAEMLIRRGGLRMLARERSGPLDDVRRALSVLGDNRDDLRARALNTLGCVEIGTGDPGAGFIQLEASLALGESLGDSGMVSVALSNLGSGAGETRHYDDAVPWLLRARDFARERDLDVSAEYARAWLARVQFEQGQWHEVDSLLDEPNPDGYLIASLAAEATAAWLRVRRGEPDPLARLEPVLERAAGVELQHRWPAVCAMAEHAWLESRWEEGRDALRPTFDEALTTHSPWAKGETGFWMWMCGEPVEPQPDHPTPFDAQIAGEWRAAADAWRDIGCPYETALALADGGVDEQVEAVAVLDRLGAAPAASRLRQRLRDQGIRAIPRGPSAATRADPHGLTKRQAAVLELAADGLTNAEIAARLFVSHRTVEHHMSAVLQKLGVATRQAAVAIVHGH